ncbi:MAG: YecA family protein [Methylococcus sp.]|nr:MAG: YecA family protein [Methylococcus sp.]
MNHPLSFDVIQDAISDAESVSASEAHGLLAGMLCMDLGIECRQWLASFYSNDAPAPDAISLSQLNQLFDQTRRQFVDFDFSFEPLLPNDDETLDSRVLALGEWCHGFLQGIGYRGANSDWPGESAEILADFLEIVRLDSSASGEDDEEAYSELAEYIRVGVQVIQREFQTAAPRQLH